MVIKESNCTHILNTVVTLSTLVYSYIHVIKTSIVNLLGIYGAGDTASNFNLICSPQLNGDGGDCEEGNALEEFSTLLPHLECQWRLAH